MDRQCQMCRHQRCIDASIRPLLIISGQCKPSNQRMLSLLHRTTDGDKSSIISMENEHTGLVQGDEPSSPEVSLVGSSKCPRTLSKEICRSCLPSDAPQSSTRTAHQALRPLLSPSWVSGSVQAVSRRALGTMIIFRYNLSTVNYYSRSSR